MNTSPLSTRIKDFFDTAFSHSERFYLCACQCNPCLISIFYKIIMKCFFIICDQLDSFCLQPSVNLFLSTVLSLPAQNPPSSRSLSASCHTDTHLVSQLIHLFCHISPEFIAFSDQKYNNHPSVYSHEPVPLQYWQVPHKIPIQSLRK